MPSEALGLGCQATRGVLTPAADNVQYVWGFLGACDSLFLFVQLTPPKAAPITRDTAEAPRHSSPW